MAMTEKAYSNTAYTESPAFRERRLRVLDGTAAREKKAKHRAEVVRVCVCVAAVAVYLLSVTFMEARIGNRAGQVSSLQRKIDSVEVDSLRADLTIGELSSLERVENYATACLGMVRPSVDDIYYLNGESSQSIRTGEALLEAEAMQAEEAPVSEKKTLWQRIGGLFQQSTADLDE